MMEGQGRGGGSRSTEWTRQSSTEGNDGDMEAKKRRGKQKRLAREYGGARGSRTRQADGGVKMAARAPASVMIRRCFNDSGSLWQRVYGGWPAGRSAAAGTTAAATPGVGQHRAKRRYLPGWRRGCGKRGVRREAEEKVRGIEGYRATRPASRLVTQPPY